MLQYPLVSLGISITFANDKLADTLVGLETGMKVSKFCFFLLIFFRVMWSNVMEIMWSNVIETVWSNVIEMNQ